MVRIRAGEPIRDGGRARLARQTQKGDRPTSTRSRGPDRLEGAVWRDDHKSSGASQRQERPIPSVKDFRFLSLHELWESGRGVRRQGDPSLCVLAGDLPNGHRAEVNLVRSV